MKILRELVLEVAENHPEIENLEETLKWGEPAYLSKKGSTLRMDWKEKSPDQYALYFQCTTSLVETFKQVFGPLFRYEGNRAILFSLDEDLPLDEIKSCIQASLTYHRVKNQTDLGIKVRS